MALVPAAAHPAITADGPRHRPGSCRAISVPGTAAIPHDRIRPQGYGPSPVVQGSPPTVLAGPAACPQALGRTTTSRLPAPSWSLYHPAAATPGRTKPFARLRRARSPIVGVCRAPGVRSPAWGSGPSSLAHVSLSVVPLAVSAWGVVRPGERRSPACRCSRGDRPSGPDSEATDHLATPPQRHPSEVDDRSTQTPLPPARRLQKPYSPPDCSCQPRIVAVDHLPHDQSPIPPPTNLLDRAGRRSEPGSSDAAVGDPRESCRRSDASARIGRPRIVARGRSSR
jgi:hypothetical protein